MLQENGKFCGLDPAQGLDQGLIPFVTGRGLARINEGKWVPFPLHDKRGRRFVMLVKGQVQHLVGGIHKVIETTMAAHTAKPVFGIAVIGFTTMDNAVKITTVHIFDALRDRVGLIEMVVPKQHRGTHQRVGFRAKGLVDLDDRFSARPSLGAEVRAFWSVEEVVKISRHGVNLKGWISGSSPSFAVDRHPCVITFPAMFLKPIVCAVACVALAISALGADGQVSISKKEDRLRVEIDGELFTEYRFQGAPHVYFYPLIGPGGAHMTRHYPMQQDSEGEDHDHHHHRSLWYSHGAVNEIDFWAETPKAGKIVHDKFLDVKSENDSAVIRSANKWIAPDGNVTCTDERLFRVYARPKKERLFDFEVTLFAGDKAVVLGDTKEGTMAIRLAETMRVTPNKSNAGKTNGHIVLSTGVRDKETWGKQAAWCDYYGPVGDKIVGVAIFDHPSNPRHPTSWHVRDYGLFAANPFGIHDFEKKPAGTGDLKIPAGKSVTFKYRFYIHEGDEQQAKVAERYAEYAGKKSQ
jgi:hypothetical protein